MANSNHTTAMIKIPHKEPSTYLFGMLHSPPPSVIPHISPTSQEAILFIGMLLLVNM
jgi:hypothetical protein